MDSGIIEGDVLNIGLNPIKLICGDFDLEDMTSLAFGLYLAITSLLLVLVIGTGFPLPHSVIGARTVASSYGFIRLQVQDACLSRPD
jgi:hypothetical protein